MNKGAGQKIAIKFTEELVGDVTGMIPKPVVVGDFFMPIGSISQSSYYSSYYAGSYAFNGNKSDMWYTRSSGDQWIQIEVPSPIFLAGFRWYVGSYAPNGFIFQTSNDGVAWDDIFIGNSENSSGWKEFNFEITDIAYKYFKWTVTSRHSSYLYIYEIELKNAYGQEGAFKVKGQQYKYVNGPLLDMDYKIASVERHPVEAKTILLTTFINTRFPTVEGMLTVEYDASLGTLAGRGGPVESFTRSFTPTELVPEPNPGIQETLTVAPAELIANLEEITYKEGFGEETISVAPAELTVELVYVGVVNP